MFKNPLKKFQQGGQVSQEQQEMLAAFVEWLPTAVEEFKNMQPEQIVEALNGMAKTPEGQKQVQSLMERFKQELNSPKMRFKEGGKIHQFICKHAKGGHVADCGCNQQGGTIDSGQQGLKLLQRAIYSGDTRNPEFSREKIRVFNQNYAKPEFDDVQLEVTGNDSTFVINRPGEPYYTVNNTNPNKPLPSDAKYSFNSVANWWNASKQNFTNIARLHTHIIPGKTLPIDEAKIDIKNPNLQNDLQRMKSSSLSMQEGGTIKAQNGGYLQSDTPEHAAALAARKTARVPWPGVGRRRMGAAMDANGGKYLYERGDVNGNTAQTSVSIPAPGDTIVRQSVATMDGWDNRTYPEGTDEYESVMKRFRPFVEYGIPSRQDGGEISRRDMFNQANENRGFNRGVARTAYANALNGLRAGGLRGRELRQAARRMVIGQPAAEETTIETTTREPLGTLTRIAPLGTVQTSLPTQLAPTSTELYDLDSMSFNDAFATMRKAGKPRFVWNGKVYTTELAEPEQGPALWGNEGFMWNDTRYAVPYGEARLRNTFLRQDGGTLEERYGTISPDSRTGIRRWIDRAIGNSSTLSEIERGINNFKNSAPGKVVQAMLPNPETGMAGAVAPVAKIAKAAKVRIPTQGEIDNMQKRYDQLANFYRNHTMDMSEYEEFTALGSELYNLDRFNKVKPSNIDFDIDKLYGNSLNFDKFDAKSLIENPPTITDQYITWLKSRWPKTRADWDKVGAGFTGGAIAGGLGMAGLVKAKQNNSDKKVPSTIKYIFNRQD